MPTAHRPPHHRTHRRDTPPPRTGGSEAETLRGFLDYLRTSVAGKVEGAPEPQVRTPAVPSGTNLLGLLNHLTHVERALFLGEEVRSWPATFRAAPEDGVAEVVARYRETVDRANRVLDACADLGEPLPEVPPGPPPRPVSASALPGPPFPAAGVVDLRPLGVDAHGGPAVGVVRVPAGSPVLANRIQAAWTRVARSAGARSGPSRAPGPWSSGRSARSKTKGSSTACVAPSSPSRAW
ncbi:hypothetical protein STENM327S_03501 [Streptomyces tendae]